MNNMKQLGMGFLQYAQDYDERLPLGTQDIYPAGNNAYRLGVGWGGQIFSYVKSTQVYKCPSDTTIATAPMVTVSYGGNNTVLQSDTMGMADSASANHLAQMNAPVKTILLFELRGSQANVTSPNESGGSSNTCSAAGAANFFCKRVTAGNPTKGVEVYATGLMGGRSYGGAFGGTGCTLGAGFLRDCYSDASGRHLEGANYLMCDGHVKWFKGSQVSNGMRAVTSNDAPGNGVNGPAAGTANSSFAITFSNI